jgi:uncharacterized delta-60 repeat protein
VIAVAPASASAAGELDTSFGSGGTVLAPVSPFPRSEANAVAIDGQGRSVVAGDAGPPSTITLSRYLSDGTPDGSFGTGGRVTTSIPGGDASPTAVAIQPDGAIVIAGIHFTSPMTEGFVARYTTSGALDPSFAAPNGIFRSTPAVAEEYDALLLQGDGKILAGGRPQTSGWLITRLKTDGTPDSTFDGDGTGNVWNDANHCGATDQSPLEDLIQLPGDFVLVGGICGNGSSSSNPITAGLGRFKLSPTANDGALDTSFGTNGTSVVTVEPGLPSFVGATARQSDGELVQVGQSGSGGSGSNAAAFALRRNADGSLDTGYGSGGATLFKVGGNPSSANFVTIDAAGRAVAAVTRSDDVGGFGVARLTTGGALDSSFGSGGINLVPFGEPAPAMSVSSIPFDLALQSDQKTVLVGFSRQGGDNTATLMRFNGDPQPGGGGGGGGGGGAGTTPQSPIVTPGSALGTLRLAGLRFNGKQITGRATCVSSPAAACSARLTLVYGAKAGAARKKKKRKPKPVTVASANLAIPAGTTQTVRLTPTRKGKALLRKKRRLAVTARFTHAATGESATSRATVTRVAAKKKRKPRR